MIVNAGKLKIEEEHLFSIHAVVSVTVCVALLAADGKLLLVAGAAELFLVSYILAALDAVERQTKRGLFIVKIKGIAVALNGEGYRLFDYVVVHLRKSLFGIKAAGCRSLYAHSLDDRAAFKGSALLAASRVVPLLGRSLGNL